jgi:hypothetical protein
LATVYFAKFPVFKFSQYAPAVQLRGSVWLLGPENRHISGKKQRDIADRHYQKTQPPEQKNREFVTREQGILKHRTGKSMPPEQGLLVANRESCCLAPIELAALNAHEIEARYLVPMGRGDSNLEPRLESSFKKMCWPLVLSKKKAFIRSIMIA